MANCIPPQPLRYSRRDDEALQLASQSSVGLISNPLNCAPDHHSLLTLAHRYTCANLVPPHTLSSLLSSLAYVWTRMLTEEGSTPRIHANLCEPATTLVTVSQTVHVCQLPLTPFRIDSIIRILSWSSFKSDSLLKRSVQRRSHSSCNYTLVKIRM